MRAVVGVLFLAGCAYFYVGWQLFMSAWAGQRRWPERDLIATFVLAGASIICATFCWWLGATCMLLPTRGWLWGAN